MTEVGTGALIRLHEGGEAPREDSVLLDESLLSALECPVCMEYMVPPISLCENGHSICDQCRPQLPLCPSCRRPFLANTRNVALESIARGLDYPCRNEGCPEVFPLPLLAPHQAVCPHRPFECPLAQASHCPWRGALALLRKHVMEEHGRYARVGAESTSVLYDLSHTPGYSLVIFAFDEVFLQKSRLQDGKFFSAVQYVGPKDRSSRFRYEFQLSRGHQRVTVGHLAHGEADDLQAVNRAGNCVRLDYDVIKRFVYDDKLPFKLSLYKIDEAAF